VQGGVGDGPPHVGADGALDDLRDGAVEGDLGQQLGPERLQDGGLHRAVEVGPVLEVAVDDGPAQPGTLRDLLDVYVGARLALLDDRDRRGDDLLAPLLLVPVPAHLPPVAGVRYRGHGRPWGDLARRISRAGA